MQSGSEEDVKLYYLAVICVSLKCSYSWAAFDFIAVSYLNAYNLGCMYAEYVCFALCVLCVSELLTSFFTSEISLMCNFFFGLLFNLQIDKQKVTDYITTQMT